MPEEQAKIVFSEEDWQLIRHIQGDLPTGKRPFSQIARQIGRGEDEVISKINNWMGEGIIKRFGALVRHERLGFTGNVMVAWQVPEPRIDEVGEKMASYPFISHCYERASAPEWPYNIYTMVHASHREEAEGLVGKVSEETGIAVFRMLFSVKEWRKRSMVYV